MATNGQLSLFRELEHLRMSRDWTYKQLAASITAKTHHRRAEDCWRRICQGLTTQPHQRTVNILEMYMDAVHANGRRRVAKAALASRLARKAS